MDLFAEPRDRALFEHWARQADRAGSRARAATVAPGRAGELAAAVGLDPHAVFSTVEQDGSVTDGYAEALKHAGKRVDIRRPGIPVRKIQLVARSVAQRVLRKRKTLMG